MEEIGPDQVRGVPATRFRVTVDASEIADLADVSCNGDFPIDVWVDATGLVRRIEGSFGIDGVNGAVAMEFYDFGVDPGIEVPSGGDVLELDLGALMDF